MSLVNQNLMAEKNYENEVVKNQLARYELEHPKTGQNPWNVFQAVAAVIIPTGLQKRGLIPPMTMLNRQGYIDIPKYIWDLHHDQGDHEILRLLSPDTLTVLQNLEFDMKLAKKDNPNANPFQVMSRVVCDRLIYILEAAETIILLKETEPNSRPLFTTINNTVCLDSDLIKSIREITEGPENFSVHPTRPVLRVYEHRGFKKPIQINQEDEAFIGQVEVRDGNVEVLSNPISKFNEEKSKEFPGPLSRYKRSQLNKPNWILPPPIDPHGLSLKSLDKKSHRSKKKNPYNLAGEVDREMTKTAQHMSQQSERSQTMERNRLKEIEASIQKETKFNDKMFETLLLLEKPHFSQKDKKYY